MRPHHINLYPAWALLMSSLWGCQPATGGDDLITGASADGIKYTSSEIFKTPIKTLPTKPIYEIPGKLEPDPEALCKLFNTCPLELDFLTRHFPELARARPLSSVIPGSDDLYDFEGCQTITPERLVEKTRVPLSELDGLAEHLHIRWSEDNTPADCPEGEDQCYMQVITAHMGETLVLDGDRISLCEDPTAESGKGRCTLVQRLDYEFEQPLTPGPCNPNYEGEPFGPDHFINTGPTIPPTVQSAVDDPLRGFVFVADRIKVINSTQIGPRSLVLVARDSLHVADDAHLSARWVRAGHLDGDAEIYEEPAEWLEALGGCELPIRRVGDGYDALPIGPPGSGYHAEGVPFSAGNLILAAPRITGRGWLDVRGLKGGLGGDAGGFGWCSDQGATTCVDEAGRPKGCSCMARAGDWAADGGNGGRGGRGGQIVIMTPGQMSLRSITFGGLGGAGGVGSYNHITGARGTSGRSGALGPYGRWVRHHTYGKGPLAWLVAARGAEAAMINVEQIIRAADPSTEEGAARRQLAISLLNDVRGTYCGAREEALPFSMDEARHAELIALCEIADLRHDQLKFELDPFGLPANSYMYVSPERVLALRNEVLSVFERYGAPMIDGGYFWQLVREQASEEFLLDVRSGDYIEQVEGQSLIIAQAQDVVRGAEQRLAQAGDTVIRSMKRLEERQLQIQDLAEAMGQVIEDVNRAMEPAPSDCDFWCTAGQLFDLSVSISRAISAFWRFDYAGLFSGVGELVDVLLEDREGFIETARQLKQVYEYGKSLYDFGVVCEKGDSECREGKGIKDLWEKASAISDGLAPFMKEDADAPAKLLAEMINASRLTEQALASQLVTLYTAIESVESASGIRDRAAAEAGLRTLVELTLRSQHLNDDISALVEAHTQAAAEALLAGVELGVAQQAARRAEARTTQLKCRLGELPQDLCGDIVPLDAHAHHARYDALRDHVCAEARVLSDRVLLLDHLYHRARDFVGLRQVSSPYNYSADLMTPEAYLQLSRDQADEALTELVNLQRSDTYGTLRGQLCTYEQGCSGEEGWDAYGEQIVSQLRDRGIARLELSPRCDQPEIGEQIVDDPASLDLCHAQLESSDVRRKRVIDFDVKLLMDPDYRLPARVSWSINYRHGAEAIFDLEDGRASFNFNDSLPMAMCRSVRAMVPDADLGFECHELAQFSGQVIHAEDTMSTYELSRIQDLIRDEYINEDLFGTSARGEWQVDVRPTLRALNGPGGDWCYQSPVPSRCAPSICDGEAPPEACEALDEICAPYFDRSRLPIHPNPSCCTASGALRLDSTDARCDGITASACQVPDICEAICGPSCKAFKKALQGMEYRVHWRAQD